MDKAPTIFLAAAEASGDEHAANLVRALRARLPDARLLGVTGSHMAEAGCESVADVTRKASMLGGTFLKVGYFARNIFRIQKILRQVRPDLFIPVDSPALNWHLSATAKKSGSKVLHYVCPQIWAWAPWRVKKLRRLTDHVACILPFEPDYLRQRGIAATFVGHPLFDSLPARPPVLPDILEAYGEGTWRIALLPGSREVEIRMHTRAMLEAAAAIRRQWPEAEFSLAARTEHCANLIRRTCRAELLQIAELAVGRTRQVLAESHFALAGSGTVTLELAHFGVPMVTLYKTSWLMDLMLRVVGRWGVPTRHFALVNILAPRRIVRELIPWHGSSRQLASAALDVLGDPGYMLELRRQLLDLVAPLHVPPPATASDNAADLAVALLGG